MYPNVLSSEFSLLQGDAVIARLRNCLAGTQPGDVHVDPRFYGLSAADAALLTSLLPANPLSAAVLVPLVAHPTGPTLMFTERASGLRKHGGQISFPGGRVEPDDNGPLGGALRESAEEIGLGAGFATVSALRGYGSFSAPPPSSATPCAAAAAVSAAAAAAASFTASASNSAVGVLCV